MATIHTAIIISFADPTPIFVALFQFFIRVILVPVVLLSLLLLSTRLAIIAQTRLQQISNTLALGLGFAIFVLFVVVDLFSGTPSGIAFDNSTEAVLSFILAGGAIGALIMFVVHVLAKSRALPIFIALLSSTSLVGLYYYALTSQSRDSILLVVVGMLVGGLLYGVIFPGAIFNVIPRR